MKATRLPYGQSRRLHEASDRAGIRDRLIATDGGGHGDFDPETWARAYRSVFALLW